MTEERMTEIRQVTEHKKAYLDLLLLADEQEDMIDRYLERGDLFVLDGGGDVGVIAQCVVTQEGDGVYELKSIAVAPAHQRRGYGKRLIDFAFSHYADCRVMLVGTGDVPSSLGFYTHCGFTPSHRVKNFFTDHYDHLMFEDGVQLVDMVYLKRERQARSAFV
jgi:GNAT superfamily N-acetyltransferase